MINSRYEEYLTFHNQMPFRLESGIRRTSTVFSSTANWHENLELQLCTAGEGRVLLDGRSLCFSADDIIAINQGVIHHTGSEGELVYTCLIFDCEFCRRVGIDPVALRFRERIDSAAVRALFDEITYTYDNETDVCHLADMNRLALCLLIELRRNFTEDTAARQSSPALRSVQEAIRFIRENYTRKLTLDEIATHLYINKYVLMRHFKKTAGKTVGDYLTSCRCQHAMQLLDHGVSVSDAALQCGFTNFSYFSKIFKRMTGCLPSEFARKHMS